MGGGTAFKPVFDYANPNDILVFYTDGYANDSSKQWDVDKLQHKPIFVLCEPYISDYYRDMLDQVGTTILIDKEDDWSEPI